MMRNRYFSRRDYIIFALKIGEVSTLEEWVVGSIAQAYVPTRIGSGRVDLWAACDEEYTVVPPKCVEECWERR